MQVMYNTKLNYIMLMTAKKWARRGVQFAKKIKEFIPQRCQQIIDMFVNKKKNWAFSNSHWSYRLICLHDYIVPCKLTHLSWKPGQRNLPVTEIKYTICSGRALEPNDRNSLIVNNAHSSGCMHARGAYPHKNTCNFHKPKINTIYMAV